MYGASDGDTISVGRDGLHLRDGGRSVALQARGIHDRDSAIERKPDAPPGVGHHGSIAPRSLRAAEAVGHAILAQITFLQCSFVELAAIYAEYVSGGGHPKGSLRILRNPKD